MKKHDQFYYALAIYIGLLFACNSKPGKSPKIDQDTLKKTETLSKTEDTTCVFQKLVVDNQGLFAKVKHIHNTCLYNYNLYLLSSDARKVFIYNTLANKLSEFKTLNKKIDSLNSALSYPTKIFVNSNNLIVKFDNGLVSFDQHLNVKYQISIDELFTQFGVFPDNKLALFYQGSVALFRTDDGGLVKKFKTDISVNAGIKSNDGVYFESIPYPINLEVKNDSLAIIKELNLKEDRGFKLSENGYIAYATKNYLIWFLFGRRHEVLITNFQSEKIIKRISLGKYDLPTDNETQVNLDQYYTDFSIELQNDNFYISHFNKHTLSIYKGCLGLVN